MAKKLDVKWLFFRQCISWSFNMFPRPNKRENNNKKAEEQEEESVKAEEPKVEVEIKDGEEKKEELAEVYFKIWLSDLS